MSFKIFKKNMLLYMENQKSIKSHIEFADKLTNEYDTCMRAGGQTVNKVGISKGNINLMKMLLITSGNNGLASNTPYKLINNIGKAIVGYWTGASLNNFPVPLIPAAGSYLNISTTSAIVTKPGIFPDMSIQYPIKSSSVFLDQLIISMKIHMATIEGVFITTSLYPGFPTIPPAPGNLSWIGYSVL